MVYRIGGLGFYLHVSYIRVFSLIVFRAAQRFLLYWSIGWLTFTIEIDKPLT